MQQDLGLLILRVATAGMMLGAHGMPKLLSFTSKMDTFADPLGIGAGLSLGLAVFAEVICSLAVIVGFKTRWAAIPLAITMIVALVLVHGNDPWAKQEFVLLYLVPFVTLIFTGGGAYSMDGKK